MNKQELQEYVQKFFLTHQSLIEMYVEKVKRLDLEAAKEFISLNVLDALIIHKYVNEYEVSKYVMRKIRSIN